MGSEIVYHCEIFSVFVLIYTRVDGKGRDATLDAPPSFIGYSRRVSSRRLLLFVNSGFNVSTNEEGRRSRCGTPPFV
jgi:hypothetical protein